MTKDKAKKIVELDDLIDHWTDELKKLNHNSGLGNVVLYFTDDFTKINGYYEKTSIPFTVGLNLVRSELVRYISDLKLYRKRLCDGGVLNALLELTNTHIPKL